MFIRIKNYINQVSNYKFWAILIDSLQSLYCYICGIMSDYITKIIIFTMVLINWCWYNFQDLLIFTYANYTVWISVYNICFYLKYFNNLFVTMQILKCVKNISQNKKQFFKIDICPSGQIWRCGLSWELFDILTYNNIVIYSFFHGSWERRKETKYGKAIEG